MTAAIEVPFLLRAAVYAHARAVFPAECCGYLVGPRDADAVDGAVACRNAWVADPLVGGRTADTAYAIAGAELLAFARTFDTPRPARVVYHSHGNGRAYLSALDREVAATPAGPVYPVQQLVIGITAAHIAEAAMFAWSDFARDFVEVARWC
ncbi:MAG TPA: Mov34/MPN/PAD-1 family protein [Kofleriaceae bacterium]|nr:Mov34/MPN/PAD-1 family protein [Kofleriaceae bacterium]